MCYLWCQDARRVVDTCIAHIVLLIYESDFLKILGNVRLNMQISIGGQIGQRLHQRLIAANCEPGCYNWLDQVALCA